MCVGLAAGLRLLSDLPVAEELRVRQRFNGLPALFLRAAHETRQPSGSLGPPDCSRAVGIHHTPHLGVGLCLHDCWEPPKGDEQGCSRPRREEEGIKDGAKLRCRLPAVLCTVPHHLAPGLLGKSQQTE